MIQYSDSAGLFADPELRMSGAGKSDRNVLAARFRAVLERYLPGSMLGPADCARCRSRLRFGLLIRFASLVVTQPGKIYSFENLHASCVLLLSDIFSAFRVNSLFWDLIYTCISWRGKVYIYPVARVEVFKKSW